MKNKNLKTALTQINKLRKHNHYCNKKHYLGEVANLYEVKYDDEYPCKKS